MIKRKVRNINESLEKKATPTPKLLIKYHNKLTSNADLPTKLVIKATNFSDFFSRVGYLCLKIMMKKNKINYTIFTIFQS